MSAEIAARLHYVDTSLLTAALAGGEARSPAARKWLGDTRHTTLTSVITEVELMRALARADLGSRIQQEARRLLAALSHVDVTAEVRAAAIEVLPRSVRSLDALHVASALVAGVDAFATLDARQGVAAEEAGLALARL